MRVDWDHVDSVHLSVLVVFVPYSVLFSCHLLHYYTMCSLWVCRVLKIKTVSPGWYCLFSYLDVMFLQTLFIWTDVLASLYFVLVLCMASNASLASWGVLA